MEQSNSSSSSSFADDLEDLDDSEIVTYCIKKLKEMRCEDHLKWLQQQFCDVAYAKCGKIYTSACYYLIISITMPNCFRLTLKIFYRVFSYLG